MEKKGNRAMEWLNLLVSEPYYLFHFLTFFSYVVLRTSAAQVLLPHITRHLLYREIQGALAFGLLTTVKLNSIRWVFILLRWSHKMDDSLVREETWEEFIANSLFFAKVFLIVLALIMDYHLAFWYTVVFLAIYILTKQPVFQGLGTAKKLTPLQLETLLTEGNTSKLWLVEFRSSYSSACICSSRSFLELSITYSNKNLSFGVVELGLFPNAAEQFGISLGGSMSQLPTYILFENATEVTRIPDLGSEAKAFQPRITKKLLSRHFELDWHLLDYVNGK